MNSEKPLTGEDSLRIIQQMIESVKYEFRDGSFYYLLWGWLVFTASMIQYLLLKTANEMSWLPWPVLMPLGGIISVIYRRRQEKKERVKTHIEEFLKYTVRAFLISLFIVLLFIDKLQLNCYPMIMIIYAIWLFISGGAIQFRPLIIGGIINWILAVAAFFFNFETQLLLIAAAVLLGYIIPGYMLKAKFKNHQQGADTG